MVCTFVPLTCRYCSHFTLGNPKKSFFNSVIHTYFRLFMLAQKKTNCYSITHHTWKMSPHYLVKCTNFSFFIFTRIKYQSAIRTSCGSVLLRHGLNFSTAWWEMQLINGKKTESTYLCRRWSLWTFAVTLLAWHSICHTSQPVLFRATNVWTNATYLQSDEKVVHFTRQCGA